MARVIGPIFLGPFEAASTTAVTTLQTVTAGNSFVIDGTNASGGVATFLSPRFLRMTTSSGASNAAVNFTIIGTTFNGRPCREILAGQVASGSRNTVNNYLTVTSVTPSITMPNSVTIGSVAANGAATDWLPLNVMAPECNVTWHGNVAGAIGNTLLYGTGDNPQTVDAPRPITLSLNLALGAPVIVQMNKPLVAIRIQSQLITAGVVSEHYFVVED